jgi:hypothetical protein
MKKVKTRKNVIRLMSKAHALGYGVLNHKITKMDIILTKLTLFTDAFTQVLIKRRQILGLNAT